MPEIQRAVEDLKENKCPRCLQSLPGKVPRCPNCGQPVTTSSRSLRLAIGIAGLLALLFAMAIMYRTVYEEDLANTAAPSEGVEKTPEEELFPPTRPEGTKDVRRPEKKPPLNER